MGFNLITHSKSTLPLENSAVAHDAGAVHVWECASEYNKKTICNHHQFHFLPR